jgi:hypothetical protein
MWSTLPVSTRGLARSLRTHRFCTRVRRRPHTRA